MEIPADPGRLNELFDLERSIGVAVDDTEGAALWLAQAGDAVAAANTPVRKLRVRGANP